MNSLFFRPVLPTDEAAIRERIFAGDVFLRPPGPAALDLVDAVTRLMEGVLETADIRSAHRTLSDATFFERIGGIRRIVYGDPEFHARVRAVVAECGIPATRVLFDPARLRVVQPGGHRNPLAAPVYYPHRDTWYAHPQGMIVWWIPLHDLDEDETFELYPDRLARPVANDSEIFAYDDWIKDGPALKIGWQKRDSGVTARYPRSLEPTLPDHAERFSCRAGEALIFSGAHYHRTLPHDRPLTRYSLDFRVVHREDAASGRGAPNVDNRSSGSTVKDYVGD